MPRKNAAAPEQDLYYDASMKAVAPPDVAKKVVRRRKPLIDQKHIQKHIAPPLSAEQISKDGTFGAYRCESAHDEQTKAAVPTLRFPTGLEVGDGRGYCRQRL